MEQNPLNEYQTGVLIPKSMTIINKNDNINLDPESENINNTTNLDSNDDEDNDEFDLNIPSQVDPRLRAKSFGISFYIKSKNPIINLCATWGRYFPKNLKAEDEDEDVLEFYERKPYFYIGEINLNDKITSPKEIYKDKKQGQILLYVNTTKEDNDLYFVTLSILNDLNQPKAEIFPEVASCIFQPSLRIILNNETEIPNFNQSNEEENELDFIYRNRPINAIGHMCSAIWKDIDYIKNIGISVLWPDGKYFIKNQRGNDLEKFIIPDIRSEFLPLSPIPLSSFDALTENESDGLIAKNLSESWNNSDFEKLLNPLVEKYNLWIENNKKERANLDNKYNKITQNLIEKQYNALQRIKLGIETIKSNDNSKLAFCFANKAIDLQSEWVRGKDVTFKWRPFQLAFFLMNIESIVNEDSKDRNTLDLLWIATGGGKTEAYLGIMAFTLALRRLNALQNDESGAGTSIISRYTLRLLTVQQFRRTLSLITAIEYLRVYDKDNLHGWRPQLSNINNDWIYGSTRFSVGMWVGKAVTPLHIRGDDGALKSLEEVSFEQEDNSDFGDPAQVVKCPVCNSWISIPKDGVPEEEEEFHKLHLIVSIDSSTNLDLIIKELENNFDFIKNISTTYQNHKKGFLTLTFSFKNQKITPIDLKNLNESLEGNGVNFASLNFYRPGYFGTLKNPHGTKFSDYETYCTNPECKLNNIKWSEGIPISDVKSVEYPDGNFKRIIPNLPFDATERMPIPAYTVDEQIYFKCPSVVISTADKIARLAFEPKTAGLFGNINFYNPFYGYHREWKDDLHPSEKSKTRRQLSEPVNSLKSPDLIIQDELHLIDGPLGSLFGLYETVISGIMDKKGGHPKYIASTATINNSEDQSNLIFSKDLFQFPPHGLTIEDNFFVKEINEQTNNNENASVWNENNPGRIYMGVYCPGKGPMTPQIRLWSSIFKTSYDNIDDEFINYYWTLIGYYNSMRELGGGGALYRQDIVERLNHINCDRKLDQETIELSSRMPSTVIPLKLSEIEMDGQNNDKPKIDAVFTTSMFGTGVDISHLSLMVVNGQPKTTGSYIQATGRIGREHGGLVVTFLKAGRPRDLNHYETFPSYHYRLHLGIEPVSVSPFSAGALNKALGSCIVSFLRNSPNMKTDWISKENGDKILEESAESDYEFFRKYVEKRLNEIYPDNESKVKIVLDNFKSQINKWVIKIDAENDFSFYEYRYKNYEIGKNVVLGDPSHENDPSHKTVYKNVPQSLREIEETTGFWV